MRVLLSTIGSRGDVQPLVALALQLKAFGQDVRLCVPPDFQEWIEALGLDITPIGPDVRKAAASLPSVTQGPLSPERMKRMAEESVATQFETIAEAAKGCDVIVGATELQIAAPSIAERMGVPYMFAAYCPAVLPSPHHPPIVMKMRGDTAPPPDADNRQLWARDAERWNMMWGGMLNAHRTALGLAPVDDARRHVLTSRPWLAADPTLGPWDDPADDAVLQTGAWILDDARPLAPELDRFLDAGDAPVYFGFGSMRAPQELARAMIDSARAHGRRAVVLRGWADLSLGEGDARDCIVVGEVNQQALFARCAGVVHHGGAGTTTAAAMSGAPQVVVPQMYDQHYWAGRVTQLGIGTAHAPGVPTTESLTAALGRALEAGVAARARTVAREVKRDGARVAAERLMQVAASAP